MIHPGAQILSYERPVNLVHDSQEMSASSVIDGVGVDVVSVLDKKSQCKIVVAVVDVKSI